MGRGGVMGQVIQFRNTECPQCPEIQPVLDIDADLAFIDLASDLFTKSINSQNFDMAMKVADQLIVSGNKMGQYAIHKTHL
jgi:hypothetical protein